jgi:hypothetical protein
VQRQAAALGLLVKNRVWIGWVQGVSGTQEIDQELFEEGGS